MSSKHVSVCLLPILYGQVVPVASVCCPPETSAISVAYILPL